MPDEIASIPDEALGFIARHLDAEAHELLAYGARAQTRSDHLQLVLDHLGWRRAGAADRERLAEWADRLVRLSCGVEDPGDLVADLRQALA